MLNYTISVADPAAHLFQVELQFTYDCSPEGSKEILLQLPAWIPGSYLLREFSRNIGEVRAMVGKQSYRLDKIDKATWVLPTELTSQQQTQTVSVQYQVYAWDFSVRAAHLDQTHGFFNFSSLCLRPLRKLSATGESSCFVRLNAPQAFPEWKVATTLPAVKGKVNPQGFGFYRANSYDELIDHPVEMGRWQGLRFAAHGVPHEAVFTGRCEFDRRRLADDLQKICAAQIAFFEPKSKQAPFARYLFMTHVSSEGYGGLEHKSSTALHCARNDLPYAGMSRLSKGYLRFLGLCSHEYFHSWNVKRIKPAAFTPYQLDRENYTSLLWIFEGFTSYYDDLMLLRAGVIDQKDYLDLLAKGILAVINQPGRLQQSLSQSSFDAWVKYYRQDENSPNSLISYYTKGALVALCLDLTIRLRTQGKRSLDDVMRLLWQMYGHDDSPGLDEDEFPAVLREATGINLNREIRNWVERPGELPLESLLKEAGFKWIEERESKSDFGANLVTRQNELLITTVFKDRPAHLAGLSAGDVITAVNGLRATEETIKTLAHRSTPGTVVRCHIFRKDELMEMELRLGQPIINSLKLEPIK